MCNPIYASCTVRARTVLHAGFAAIQHDIALGWFQSERFFPLMTSITSEGWATRKEVSEKTLLGGCLGEAESESVCYIKGAKFGMGHPQA